MSHSQTTQAAEEVKHPHPLDRNRSIIWARNLLEIPNWAILCVRETQSDNGNAALVSISVANSRGKVIFDAIVRPPGTVTSDLIRKHGVSDAEVFKALEAPVLFAQLSKLISRREIICWNSDELRRTVENCASSFDVPVMLLRLISLDSEYARFAGTEKISGIYQTHPLPDLSAKDQCRFIYELVMKMASSSQKTDLAPSGDRNWTAAFFKPKAGPMQKIKSMLGLDQ